MAQTASAHAKSRCNGCRYAGPHGALLTPQVRLIISEAIDDEEARLNQRALASTSLDRRDHVNPYAICQLIMPQRSLRTK